MDRKEEVLRKLGRRVAALRREKKLSIAELAGRSGLDRRQIARIEAGKVNVLFSTILALSRGLAIPPQELVDTL